MIGTSFLSYRESVEEEYEYANEFVKQGVKNLRKEPVIHECFIYWHPCCNLIIN